jgi:hypothetical protein
MLRLIKKDLRLVKIYNEMEATISGRDDNN